VNKNKITGKKSKMIYITGSKNLLTLIHILKTILTINEAYKFRLDQEILVLSDA